MVAGSGLLVVVGWVRWCGPLWDAASDLGMSERETGANARVQNETEVVDLWETEDVDPGRVREVVTAVCSGDGEAFAREMDALSPIGRILVAGELERVGGDLIELAVKVRLRETPGLAGAEAPISLAARTGRNALATAAAADGRKTLLEWVRSMMLGVPRGRVSSLGVPASSAARHPYEAGGTARLFYLVSLFIGPLTVGVMLTMGIFAGVAYGNDTSLILAALLGLGLLAIRSLFNRSAWMWVAGASRAPRRAPTWAVCTEEALMLAVFAGTIVYFSFGDTREYSPVLSLAVATMFTVGLSGASIQAVVTGSRTRRGVTIVIARTLTTIGISATAYLGVTSSRPWLYPAPWTPDAVALAAALVGGVVGLLIAVASIVVSRVSR